MAIEQAFGRDFFSHPHLLVPNPVLSGRVVVLEHVGDQVAVGEHGSLGEAGCARRVGQRRQCVVRHGAQRRYGGPRALPPRRVPTKEKRPKKK